VWLELEHDVQAPARARRWLTDACLTWRCEDLAPDAALLVSELTTNSVLHAGTSCRVEADYNDPVLRVSVSDDVPGDVGVAGQSIDAERGRGLTLVDALATAWGVSPTLTGKSVWFVLSTPSATERHRARVRRRHLSVVPNDLL
jgi:anti-sigma regulatory factor (Ser/Thr protein kinase)